MGELPHKYEVTIKTATQTHKLPDNVKEEMKSSGLMDDKGKLKLKGVSQRC